jgi:predicted nucleotidyltransferase component of viral defense system
MFESAIDLKTRQVLNKIKDALVLDDFYLAGGTALSLILGHRKSVDLDFFCSRFPKVEILIAKLKHLSPKIINQDKGTLDLYIDGVKVSFLEYKYPLIGDFLEFDGVKIASLDDIACMKLSAISSRGSKKDFIDLYFILQKKNLKELLSLFEKKFEGVNYQMAHILKSLIYFEEAEKDPDPLFLVSFDWEKAKDFLKEVVLSSIR